MSDSESTTAVPPHPNLGGKSIHSIERPRYKSWRKKYRKMRFVFDQVLEDNKALFKEEQKLEGIAKRMREELDGILDLCLDLNSTPSIPPSLRYNINLPDSQKPTPACTGPDAIPQQIVPPDITPQQAQDMLMEYTMAVRNAQIPNLDLHVIRQMIDERLAAQEVLPLEELERTVPPDTTATATTPASYELAPEAPEFPNYLNPAQETQYLARLDQAQEQGFGMSRPSITAATSTAAPPEPEKHWAELTPRELERQTELSNPQSQHNWLKTHTKPTGDAAAAGAEDESDVPTKPKAKPRSKNTLAKQVGDRALERERAREGSVDEDDLMMGADETGGGGRRKGKDPDSTYRVKGGKGGSGAKGKRKRSGEDLVHGHEVGTGKRARVDGE